MATNVLTIPYPEELLLSLKENPAQFESEARLLLAVKLYELGRVSTGMAARLGLSQSRVVSLRGAVFAPKQSPSGSEIASQRTLAMTEGYFGKALRRG